MKLKRIFAFLVVWMTLASAALAECPVVNRIEEPGAPSPFAEDAGLLEIWFPQIADADAAVIRLDGKTWVIDCATAKFGPRLVKLLDALGTERIEAVYNTHPHHDHTDGFPFLAEKYDIGEFFVCFAQDYNEVMIAAVETAAAHEIPVTAYANGDVLQLGEASLEVYMTGREDWNLNNQSAMMWLRYGDATMLFAADLEQRAQKYIAETLPEGALKVDILKYPHHGVKTMARLFADAVDPAFAVVTSNGRVYETRYDLGLRKIPFAMTMSGWVRVSTDGAAWMVELFEPDEMAAE